MDDFFTGDAATGAINQDPALIAVLAMIMGSVLIILKLGPRIVEAYTNRTTALEKQAAATERLAVVVEQMHTTVTTINARAGEHDKIIISLLTQIMQRGTP